MKIKLLNDQKKELIFEDLEPGDVYRAIYGTDDIFMKMDTPTFSQAIRLKTGALYDIIVSTPVEKLNGGFVQIPEGQEL